MRFTWGSEGEPLRFEVTVPPVPLLSNAAKHIYNGLFAHPLAVPIMKFEP